jgi:hypothetical protein
MHEDDIACGDEDHVTKLLSAVFCPWRGGTARVVVHLVDIVDDLLDGAG